MRGLCFICNTPSAAMASSVLHPPVESATQGGHPDQANYDRLTQAAQRVTFTLRGFKIQPQQPNIKGLPLCEAFVFSD
jgi:hypothetical protein